jgi:hypothetical protein
MSEALHTQVEMSAEEAAENIDGDVVAECPVADRDDFTWANFAMVSALARQARQKVDDLADWASAAGHKMPAGYSETADALAWVTESGDNFRAFREVMDSAEGGDMAGPASHDSSVVNNGPGW